MRWVDRDLEEDRQRQANFLRAQESILHLPEDRDRTSSSNLIAWLSRSLRIEQWQASQRPSQFPPADALEALVDLSQIAGALKVRARLPGDVIQPFGMSNKVKLKKYLHTHSGHKSTPQPLLHSANTTIVVSDEEEVLWVPQIGLSEKLRVRSKPTHRLIWLEIADGTGSIIA